MNPDYIQSLLITLKIHLLMAEGLDESEYADQLRDESESPWWKMTQEERESVGKFSEALYKFAEEHPFVHKPTSP